MKDDPSSPAEASPPDLFALIPQMAAALNSTASTPRTYVALVKSMFAIITQARARGKTWPQIARDLSHGQFTLTSDTVRITYERLKKDQKGRPSRPQGVAGLHRLPAVAATPAALPRVSSSLSAGKGPRLAKRPR